MRLKKQHSWAVAAVTGLILVGCAPAAPVEEGTEADAGGTHVFNIVTASSEANYDGVALQAFMDKVTEETDGRITFDAYFSGSLVAYGEQVEATRSGLVDIAAPGWLVSQELTPALQWITSAGQTAAPASFPHSVLASTGAMQDYFRSPASIEEYARSGLVPIAAAPATLASVFCTQDFEALEGIQGRTVRAAGGDYTADAEALGMSPVSLSPTEIYEGLQRGVIDCAMFDSAAMNAFVGFDGVTTQYLLPLSAGISTLIMNEQSFGELSPGDQQVILDAGVWYAVENARAYIAQLSAAYSEGAEHLSMRIVPEMVGVLDDMRGERRADLEASPPAASTLEDAEATLARYLATMAEWTDVLTDDIGLPLVSPDASSHALKANLISSGEDPRVDSFLQLLYEDFTSTGARN